MCLQIAFLKIKGRGNRLMKKWFKFALLGLILFALVACQSAEESTTKLVYDEDGFTNEIVLIAEGDKVIEQTSKTETTYEALGVSTAEEAEEMMAEFLVGYDSTEGVKHQIDYLDDRLVESVTVNYDAVDIDEMSELAGSFVDGDASKGVSLKLTVEMMEEVGYKIVD